MSDLNDFFAKKDRKKKRAAAAKSAQVASVAKVDSGNPSDAVKGDGNPPRNGAAQPTTQPDDGWIEIEDPRGSQVNTGGRTVAEFRRDVEEKESGGDSTAQTEKFSGWAKADAPEADTDEKTGAAPTASPSAFPSLADAAKVQTVAPVQSHKSGSNSTNASSQASPFGARGRPRFTVDKEKLRRKMAEREAAGKSGM